MAEDQGGGYHWLDPEYVEKWEERRSAIDTERQAGFRGFLRGLPADVNTKLRFVDLGAGDGKVAELVLENYPVADATLVDFSAPMMEKGTQALRRFASRFRYCHWDMNIGDWPSDLGGPFDAVLSSAAIHHLTNDRKRWLTEGVFERLTPGGIFANYDLFRYPGASFSGEDNHDRMCASVEESTAFLTAVGYEDMVVAARSPRPAHNGELALVMGRRPSRIA
jgi:SAM-dependent methyltransferase